MIESGYRWAGKKMHRVGLVLVAACWAFICTADGRGEGETDRLRSTVDGGAVRSTGGDVVLSGTTGQPNGGVMTGGEFTLTSGFWFLPALGDCNLDGGINLHDYEVFPDCMSGPAGGESGPECVCLDWDQDGAIDMRDFAELQRRHSG